ncbi:MAG TPA: TlpA disulfide reductase family protein [Candidatus Baltobacteraceae bacterium]|nr:TlpA disulfide reductase family protein [Candidatus Baltobacteraceae bacterium]
MNRYSAWAAAVLIAALAISPRFASAARIARVNQPAPLFLLDTLDGKTLSHADITGKRTYINVFATWCPPCQSEIPRLVRAAQQHPDVRFIFVDEQESPSAVKRFVQRYGIRGDVAIDQGQFAATYGALPIPESILIDEHGVVRMLYRGPIPQGLLQKVLGHDTK